jgi:hypothetical protein
MLDDDKTPPEDHKHLDPARLRVVRAEDVAILKAVTRIGHLVWILAGFLVTVIGLVFAAGRTYADIPTKEMVVSATEYEKHKAGEDKVMADLGGKIDALTGTITQLSITVAVLNKEMADDERHASK